ncbi:MAG: WD40 repeat domain-containing protein [Methylovirgula sp.]|uniref:WD40 repeat domain-containing protein n=1 Tax=Methylovirgula sp. TaxID=1978224 RepID=UPI00307643D4
MDDTASLTDRVSPIAAGAHVTAAAFLGPVGVLALGDGTVVRVEDQSEDRIPLHPDGAILVAAMVGKRLITGGDDGRIVALNADGTHEEIFREDGKWIDALAAREDGALAWSCGKQVFARDAQGRLKNFNAPSTVRGLAFAPKGYRLAIAHYNGASLWFPDTNAPPELLDWKGAHLDATFAPDGRFLVTSMQENALHGWRLSDKRDMRMSGYPAKTRSLSWSHDGRWLATSGAEACIVWPFKDKDGPMGKQPRECGVRRVKVSRVACHPKALAVAIGYEDGWILLCRMTDGAEILIRRTEAGTHDPITAFAWNRDGRRLLFGTGAGEAGLLEMPG